MPAALGTSDPRVAPRSECVVDAEHLARDNKRLAPALREAKPRIANACIEDIDYGAKREIDRALLRQLGTCALVTEGPSRPVLHVAWLLADEHPSRAVGAVPKPAW